MSFSRDANAFFEHFAHPGIVPTFDSVDLNAVGIFFFLHPAHRFRN